MPNMFDKYFICRDSLSNVVEDGEITGFRVGVRVSYYRGVNLAIIHDFRVTADGETFDKSQMTFTVKAGTFRFDEMEGRTDVRWEFGEVAWLTVKKPGGLAEGTHRIHVFEEIRIVNGMNIKPVMFTAEWEETMDLGPDWVQPPKIRRGVSFYSYQDECYLGKLDLEGCIKEVADTGADGIEIISESIIPNFPNPPKPWVDRWFSLMDQYGTKPICYDMFMDGQIIDGEDINEAQAVEIMETNIRLAARLGFQFLRVVYTIPLSIIEKALPCAEQYNVVMGLELHPPFRLGTPQVDQYVEFIERTKTKYFGLIPDFGIFIDKPIPALEKKAVKRGANPEAVRVIHDCYSSRKTYEEALEAISGLDPNAEDLAWAKSAYSYTYCDPELLKHYLPYTVHVHAKVYDMEDGVDPSVDNETIFRVLKENGWEGYVCTEYEGQRIYHDMAEDGIDNLAFIRAHQRMMEHYITGR